MAARRRLHRPFVVAEARAGEHKFVWLGLDEADAEKGILANQYLIVDSGSAMLLDPGAASSSREFTGTSWSTWSQTG